MNLLLLLKIKKKKERTSAGCEIWDCYLGKKKSYRIKLVYEMDVIPFSTKSVM